MLNGHYMPPSAGKIRVDIAYFRGGVVGPPLAPGYRSLSRDSPSGSYVADMLDRGQDILKILGFWYRVCISHRDNRSRSIISDITAQA